MIKGNGDTTYKTLQNKFIYLYIPQWKEWKKNILDFCDAVQNSKLSIEELNKWYKTISTNINIHLLKDTPLYTSLTKALSCLTLKASDTPTQTVFKEQIHNATLLPSFLYENFSKNDPLKFITHIWDGNADNCKFEGYEDFSRNNILNMLVEALVLNEIFLTRRPKYRRIRDNYVFVNGIYSGIRRR